MPISTINGETIAVTTAGIADGSVTHAKMAGDAIGTDNLMVTSVTMQKLGYDVLTDGRLGCIWERGTLNAAGKESSSSTRARTENFLMVDNGMLSLSIAEGARASVRVYTGPSSSYFVRTTDWMTGNIDMDVSDGPYVKLCGSYDDDRTMTLAEAEAFGDVVVESSYSLTDKTLTRSGKPADAAVVGQSLQDISGSMRMHDVVMQDGCVPCLGPERGSFEAYKGVSAEVDGSYITLNGTSTGSIRIKLTNGVVFGVTPPASWLAEDMGLVEGRTYAATATSTGGTCSGTGSLSANIYGDNSTSAKLSLRLSDGDGCRLYGIPALHSRRFVSTGTNAAFLCLYITTGVTFTDFRLRVDMLDVTETLNVIDVDQIKQDIQDAIDVPDRLPDYYFDDGYLQGRVAKILSNYESAESANSHDVDSFIWFTDPHYFNGNGGELLNAMKGVGIMKYVREHTGIRRVFCGGDLLAGNVITAANAKDFIGQVISYHEPIADGLYNIIGNHEWNNPSGSAEQEINELYLRTLYPMLQQAKEDSYYSRSQYADFCVLNRAQKIAYICISCRKNSQTYTGSTSWLAETASGLDSGYTIVVIAHYAGGATFDAALDVCDAISAGTSVTIDGVTYDYADSGLEVACIIGGHKHYDADLLTTGGLHIVWTTCDRGPKSDSSEEFTESRELGTVKEQAIDVVQIDKSTKTVYFTRVGGANLEDGTTPEQVDRTFTYGAE